MNSASIDVKVYLVARISSFPEFNFAIRYVLREQIFAIVKDWFFLLGK